MPKTFAEDFNSQWKKLSENRQYFSKSEFKSLRSGLNSCRRVLNRARSSLHKYPNVIGSGVSLKFKHRELLLQPCIVVRVSKKIPNLKEGALPSEIEGCPLDVIETGFPQPSSAFLEPACRLRPGNSIRHPNGGWGTIGCLVRERLPIQRSKELYSTLPQSDFLLLSCNHVIARYNGVDYVSGNEAEFRAANAGDDLLHPGVGGSGSALPCAKLVRWGILYGYPQVNEIDAAVAKPIIPVNPNRQGQGIPHLLGDAEVLDEVYLTGAASGHTHGTVFDIDADFTFPHFGPRGRVDFIHSIVTSKMSQGGDSGSVIVKKDPNIGGSQLVAVGLLIGDTLTFEGEPPLPNLPFSYFSHLRKVLNTLNVDLIVETGWPHITWD